MAMTRTLKGRQQQGERGFTLIEALIAVVVLVFGLIAVAQLMAVATSSNAIANRSTIAAAMASEELERLMTVPYGSLTLNAGADLNLEDTPGTPPAAPACISGASGRVRDVQAVRIRTCWRIETAGGVARFLTMATRITRLQAIERPSGARRGHDAVYRSERRELRLRQIGERSRRL